MAGPRQGYSPKHDMTKPVPDGYMVRGVSTYYDEEGKVRGQWVKSQVDAERQAELMRAACEAMVADLPQIKPRAPGRDYLADLMTAYPIGDAHIGMLAWGEECGDDFDMKIAERVQCAAMDALVKASPATETALIVDLGDYLHADNRTGVTARGGNILDMDGRYAKMARIGCKVMRQGIESALSKHKTVHVLIEPGNHNDVGAIWMALALSQIYEREPRVLISTSPSRFLYHRFGKVLIGVHHGDTCKIPMLPGVMATDQAEAWGKALHRYWFVGHVHHQSVHEFPGCVVETFNTLAPKDAYATEHGYRARQNMKAIVMHKEFGEVARHTVHPRMLS